MTDPTAFDDSELIDVIKGRGKWKGKWKTKPEDIAI